MVTPSTQGATRGMCQMLSRALVLSLLGLAGSLQAGFPDAPNMTVGRLAYPYQVELGDLNQDGRCDLAVARWHRLPVAGEVYDHDRDRVLLFYQGPEGTFPEVADREISVRSPWAMRAGDFDQDGKTDLAIKETRRFLHVLLGSEALQKLHTSANVNDSDRQLAVGRLSPGGLMDFLPGPAWRKWRGGDVFAAGYCYGPKQNDNQGGTIADLNQDGHNDMVFLAAKAIRVYYGPFGTMTVKPEDLTELLEIETPLPVASVQVADLTGDGRPDIVAGLADRASGKRAVALYQQRSPVGFARNPEPTALLEGVGGQVLTTDLDRDGMADLIVADDSKRQIHVWRQAKGTTFPTTPKGFDQTLKAPCYQVTAGDIDGDGFPDLAVTDGSNRVSIYLNDGRFAPRPAPALQPTTVAKEAAVHVPPRPKKETVLPVKDDAAASLGKLPPPVRGPDHADSLRMPFYTGVVLPTPQQATYRDEYCSLRTVGLLLGKEIEPEGPLVRRLRERVERYGGKVQLVESIAAQVDTVILFGNAPGAKALLGTQAVPEREQGYLMVCTEAADRKVVILQGHDRLGLLWAVSSFAQLVSLRAGECVVRSADIVDYPVAANRGFIAGNWVDAVEYCVAFKINKPVFQTALMDRTLPSRKEGYEAWQKPLSEATRADLAAYAAGLTPLGIEWYAGHNPIAAEKKIQSGDEGDFQVLLGWACAVEELGGHLCIKYDDHRFPISQEDMAQFGSAREADVHLLLRLHRELKKRYPRAKILFCPPFYWGPSSPAMYPEKRDDYLFALGANLPADIEIFWTGPKVKSTQVTPAMTAWITKRLRRRPVYWQNGFATPHMFLYHYVTDPIPALGEWYYDGFLAAVDTYMFNCMMPGYAAAAAVAADYCWNPSAYDPDRSIREAATKLVGADTYPALVALNQALVYFDKFGLRRTPGAAQQLPEMGRRLAVVNAVWEEIQANRNAAAVARWTDMDRHVAQVNRFHRGLEEAPDLAAYRRDAATSQGHAAAEVGLKEGVDTFLSAYDFTGGFAPKHYANRCEKRLATWVYAKRSANPSMAASFRVEPFPPDTDYELVLCAQDDDAEAKCDIRIQVNGTTVFEGENPHVRLGWSRQTYRIPAQALQRRSKLTIENIEQGGSAGGPPFFMLNYAVVRKKR